MHPYKILLLIKVHRTCNKLSSCTCEKGEVFNVKIISMIDVSKKGAVHKVTFIETILWSHK